MDFMYFMDKTSNYWKMYMKSIMYMVSYTPRKSCTQQKGAFTLGKSSQSKGRRGEIELAQVLQSHGYNVEPGRALSYGEVPDLSGLHDVHIECKRAETLRLSEWMAQAERDAQRFGDGLPAVFFRRSRSPWMVCMKLSDWIQLYRGRGCKCGGRCAHESGGDTSEE